MVLTKLKELLGKKEDRTAASKEGSGPSPPNVKAKMIELFLPVANQLESFFPNLKKDLIQAEIEDISAVRYLADSLFKAAGASIMLSATVAVLGWWKYALLALPVIFFFGVFTLAKRPKIKAKKRTRELEKDLPYALRHILIEVEAGVTLYQAMVSVTEGYGEASKEFRRIVNEISAGTSEIEALENAILRNPSKEFRRGLWQIINSLKSGADVSTTLRSLVDTLMENQILEVRKYGKELNPYTLMYMLIAIILPSLGVTFLMIISTFTGISLPPEMFYGILIGLVLFQLMFINIVKSKRPLVKN